MEYRKKPVVIEAIQWTGQNHREMFNFLGGENEDYLTAVGTNFYIDWSKVEGGLIINTLEGEHIATIGDWIIKGIKGEYYPCKADIFKMTYELASTSSQTEISDKEIEKQAYQFKLDYEKSGVTEFEVSAFIMGMKKYREQLKNK